MSSESRCRSQWKYPRLRDKVEIPKNAVLIVDHITNSLSGVQVQALPSVNVNYFGSALSSWLFLPHVGFLRYLWPCRTIDTCYMYQISRDCGKLVEIISLSSVQLPKRKYCGISRTDSLHVSHPILDMRFLS